jgi:replicative DNA helicase
MTPEFIKALADTGEIRGGAIPFRDVLSNLYDEVSERAESPLDIWGIRTGFPKFDKLTGGLQPGELFILSGEPGVGKSMLAMQMAAQMAKGQPGVIYSIEMKSISVARRLVSGKSSIPTRDLKTGKVREEDWPIFTHVFEELSDLPIHISDCARMNILSLRKDISRLVATQGIRWFVLDYLYLLDEGPNEIERTQRASSGLKTICREFDLSGTAIHSMNKAGIASVGQGSDDAPTQDKLRGSGQSIYDADLIAFLTKYNPKSDPGLIKVLPKDQENVRMLWFGKGRELEDNDKMIKFVKRPNLPAFEEYSPEVRP